MGYEAILCVFSAVAPFVAIAREVIRNRRPWFTWCLVIGACAFAVIVSVIYFYFSVSDAMCFNYAEVVDRLWRCSGVDYSLDSTCCHEVEDDVSAGCGWIYSRAEFCSEFGEATQEYCRVEYCPPFSGFLQISHDVSGKINVVKAFIEQRFAAHWSLSRDGIMRLLRVGTRESPHGVAIGLGKMKAGWKLGWSGN